MLHLPLPPGSSCSIGAAPRMESGEPFGGPFQDSTSQQPLNTVSAPSERPISPDVICPRTWKNLSALLRQALADQASTNHSEESATQQQNDVSPQDEAPTTPEHQQASYPDPAENNGALHLDGQALMPEDLNRIKAFLQQDASPWDPRTLQWVAIPSPPPALAPAPESPGRKRGREDDDVEDTEVGYFEAFPISPRTGLSGRPTKRARSRRT
jgi:hypothetical protein